MNYDKKLDLLLAFSKAHLESIEKKIYERDELIEAVNYAVTNMSKIDIDSDMKEEAVKHLESMYNIRCKRGISIVSEHKKWFLDNISNYDFLYWYAYIEYLENEKNFTKSSLTDFEYTMDDLTDLLGNPKGNNTSFDRTGLVIGDVQSGKTANYTGLINRAADIGFKMIIVLTGITETLRSQTQARIDEGFIGFDSDSLIKSEKKQIGVGKSRKRAQTENPVPLTSKSFDFDTKSARRLLTSISTIKTPVVAVLKKNSNVLKNLRNWLNTMSGQNNIINEALLIVDDEADFASLNTNKPEEDPTAINKEIRKIRQLFRVTSYVGFTATPYANVFIDPDAESEDYEKDLFPKDYIYCLEAPSNYIGARNIHIAENSKLNKENDHSYMVKFINDLDEKNEILPLKHKKDFIFNKIPKTLEDAIYCFFIANTARDIRLGQRLNKGHRSMLINISIYKDVHKLIHSTVSVFVNEIIKECRMFSKMPNWQQSQHLIRISEIYKNDYSNIAESWDLIRKNLFDSVANIKVYTANSESSKTNSKLTYEEYENGARAIVIGGFSLSRGITLEGLMVSYTYRGSKNYDTLLQMGRWFGYRNGYADLCKVWLTEDLSNAFKEISESSDELRDEAKEIRSRGGMPNDFGLRVRSSKMGLAITARNKMRTSKTHKTKVDFSGDVIETHKVYSGKEINLANSKNTIEFIQENFKYLDLQKDRVVLKDVNFEEVFNFLRKLQLPYNEKFNVESLYKYTEINLEKLKNWDVAIIEGNGSTNKELKLTNGKTFNRSLRKYSIVNDKVIHINKSRLGSVQHGEFGLSENLIKKTKDTYKKEVDIIGINSQRKWFSYFDFSNEEKTRNPLICIYFIELGDLINQNDENEKLENDIAYFSLSIGIPMVSILKGKTVEYQINKRFYEEVNGDIYED